MLYHDENYLREYTTQISGIFSTDDSHYVSLKQSLFYPKGGGQKGDRGSIRVGTSVYQVLDTVFDHERTLILSRLATPIVPDGEDQQVVCTLDWDYRYRQMRLHTGLHLVHCCLEAIKGSPLAYPKTSDIESGFAYNKYPNASLDGIAIAGALDLFRNWIQQDISVTTYPDPNHPGHRYWQCMDFVIPCGGIHVNNVCEIADAAITTSTKKGNTTFKITLSNQDG